ncbi:hypothetical protein I302_102630 [Kwoniella bestiolae CBS 10118]|uniref:Uncharacterized protein n=1 Tax=Kwoniella bestiolae CBS 10118 TaxID=1296100 RepID=A0AAJ8K3W2_9TREE
MLASIYASVLLGVLPLTLGAVIPNEPSLKVRGVGDHPIWNPDGAARIDIDNNLALGDDLGIKVSLGALVLASDLGWVKDHIVPIDEEESAIFKTHDGSKVNGPTIKYQSVAEAFDLKDPRKAWWWLGAIKAVRDAPEGDQSEPDQVLRILTGKEAERLSDLSIDDYGEFIIAVSNKEGSDRYRIVTSAEGDNTDTITADTTHLGNTFWEGFGGEPVKELKEAYDTLIVLQD